MTEKSLTTNTSIVSLTDDDLILAKQEELELTERQLQLREGLPHLHGWKYYPWARKFFESTNKENFLCAANQISKSSIQIRKSIHWATEDELWPSLWVHKPLQFWYLYPTFTVATIEFRKKWVPEFMPRNEFKDHPKYGWKPEYKNGFIVAVHFNSNVSIYFKTYAMDVQDLQTGSCDSIFLDEECPDELLAELQMRLVARRGYFHAVFTPTLGQEVWRCAFEEKGKKSETFVGALKQQVSMFDCLYYDDGTRSPWTIDAINRAIRACRSEAQIQRRIYGKFISDEGLKYPSFERNRNIVPEQEYPVPKHWEIYVGADVGSGGADNHPSAIIFVAISPDRQRGIVFKGWRGDGIITTAADVVTKVVEMSEGLKVQRIFYDYSSRDFYTIAEGMGLPVEAADKLHAVGEQVINVLFRNALLSVYDSADLEPLAVELTTLKAETPKRFAKDDYCDALRYAVSKIPWDWSVLTKPAPVDSPRHKDEITLRREYLSSDHEDNAREFEEWNELYESYG
jgi:hypothetical protein